MAVEKYNFPAVKYIRVKQNYVVGVHSTAAQQPSLPLPTSLDGAFTWLSILHTIRLRCAH